MNFKGLGTAIITPFKNGGEIDYSSLERFLDFQIKGGVDYLVVAGTTGEGTSLTEKELFDLLIFCKAHSGGKPIVAGSGGNNTAVLCEKITKLNSLKLDGYLVASPYYNKPTQEGLLKHYAEVSKAAKDTKIILYNIPGRTGGWILSDTVAELAVKHKNICAIKEASGDLSFAMELYQKVSMKRPDFIFLSGDDAFTLPFISVGYQGVISVVSNEFPKEMKLLVDKALEGDFEGAKKIHYGLLDIMKANFVETSPSPVKYVMKKMGFGDASVRLPLSELKNTQKLDELLSKGEK